MKNNYITLIILAFSGVSIFSGFSLYIAYNFVGDRIVEIVGPGSIIPPKITYTRIVELAYVAIVLFAIGCISSFATSIVLLTTLNKQKVARNISIASGILGILAGCIIGIPLIITTSIGATKLRVAIKNNQV